MLRRVRKPHDISSFCWYFCWYTHMCECPDTNMPLTDTFVRQVKHNGTPSDVKYSDTQALYLHVKKAGKYWRMSYRLHGKQRLLALGVYPAVSLAKARQLRSSRGWKAERCTATGKCRTTCVIWASNAGSIAFTESCVQPACALKQAMESAASNAAVFLR